MQDLSQTYLNYQNMDAKTYSTLGTSIFDIYLKY